MRQSQSMPEVNLHICIAEDRDEMEPALRLLLQSLSRNAPGSHVHLFVPNASQSFQDLLPLLNIQCTFESVSGYEPGYNVKPFALLHLLNHGYERVLWIDSDIVSTPALRPFLQRLEPGALVVCEEMLGRFHQDGGNRTNSWGFVCGRVFPFALNSGVLRVEATHQRILEHWASLLETDTYRAAQSKKWDQRPHHLLGDQDVLTALLGSVDYADVPVQILRRGPGIIQFSGPYGYTLSERIQHLIFGLPPFIHSLGSKPWLVQGSDAQFYERFSRLYQACSPYTLSAKQYAGVLASKDWLAPRSRMEWCLRAMGFGSIALSGLPLAALADGIRLAKRVRSALRWG